MYLLTSIWNRIIKDTYKNTTRNQILVQWKYQTPSQSNQNGLEKNKAWCVINWPAIYNHDIATYFKAKSQIDFINRLHSRYKQGKAYWYFAWEYLPGGQIISAFCHCTAGLMGLCNHNGGMLFCVKVVKLQGLTHLNCTCILAKWNIRKLKTKADPVKLKASHQFLLNLITRKK